MSDVWARVVLVAEPGVVLSRALSNAQESKACDAQLIAVLLECSADSDPPEASEH